MSVSLRLNGIRKTLSGPGNGLLLHALRDSGYTGTKEGCAEGECGACAIAVATKMPDGSIEYRAVNSCLMMTFEAEGLDVITVEGVAQNNMLHPVQEAMAKDGGSQCGYCTPGFVVSMFCEYERCNRLRGPLNADSVSGNLCRCTGYRPIREALGCGETLPGIARRLPVITSNAPNVNQPHDLRSVLLWRRANPSGVLVAGATDVLAARNQNGLMASAYLSLKYVHELHGIEHQAAGIRIGAATPLNRIDEHPRTPDLLRQLWPLFASRLIRERATLGGNLGTASPIGDSAPALLALNASVEVAGLDGDRVATRMISLDDYFLGYRKTALRADELIVAVHVPYPVANAVQRFFKVSKRLIDDISAVSLATVFTLENNRIMEIRIALGGVAATTIRARKTEQAAIGMLVDEANTTALGAILQGEFSPISDARASALYRAQVAGALLQKLVSTPSMVSA